MVVLGDFRRVSAVCHDHRGLLNTQLSGNTPPTGHRRLEEVLGGIKSAHYNEAAARCCSSS